MAAYHSEFITDLALPPVQRPVPHQFVMGDNDAYTFTALVCDSGQPEMALLDGNVTGSLVRPDGAVVAFVGTKGDAVQQVQIPQPNGTSLTCNATACSVTVPQACFAYPGRVTMVIKLTDGDTITQALDVSALVLRTSTGVIVDPGEVIPEPGELYWIAQEAQAAAEEAEAAAQHAVRYDVEQELTPAQQMNARANIDAPATQAITDLDINKADKSTVNTLSGRVDGLSTALSQVSGALSAESATRAAADEALDTAKADKTALAEVSDAVDGLVQTVTDLSGTVTQEIADREAAEAALDAAKADKTTVTNLSTVVSHNSQNIRYLQADVSSEASTRAAADTALGGQISDEAAARVAGDGSTLSTAEAYADGIVSTEATARAGGDADTLAAAKAYADGLVITDAVRTSAQELTADQQRQARENIDAEVASAVEIIIPETDAAYGYIRVTSPSSATSVTMDGTTPEITKPTATASSKPYYMLIEVSEGETYSIYCRSIGSSSPGMLLLAADGTILDRQVGAGVAARQVRVITIPSTAKWLYILINRATNTSANAKDNRYWDGAYTPVQISMLGSIVADLDATKQDAAVVETISNPTASITAQDNTIYKCGTMEELSITAPASGLFSVRWTSGSSTATVLSLTGITKPEWWDGLCETGRVYELSVQDGYGVVMSWAT